MNVKLNVLKRRPYLRNNQTKHAAQVKLWQFHLYIIFAYAKESPIIYC